MNTTPTTTFATIFQPPAIATGEEPATLTKVTFRGIPRELNAALNSIAAELCIPVSELARAFLEYGVRAYQEGELIPQPVLSTNKRTLYPKA